MCPIENDDSSQKVYSQIQVYPEKSISGKARHIVSDEKHYVTHVGVQFFSFLFLDNYLLALVNKIPMM